MLFKNATAFIKTNYILKSEPMAFATRGSNDINRSILFWCLMPFSAIFQLYHGDQF